MKTKAGKITAALKNIILSYAQAVTEQTEKIDQLIAIRGANIEDIYLCSLTLKTIDFKRNVPQLIKCTIIHMVCRSQCKKYGNLTVSNTVNDSPSCMSIFVQH